MATKTKKVNVKKLLVELQKDFGVTVPKTEEEYALAYIEQYYTDLVEEHPHTDADDLTAHDYALAKIGNGLTDGAHMDDVEVTDLGNGLALQVEKDQQIIEVDQETVKKALKSLLTSENKFLAMLYEKHEEYNNEYFNGALAHPLITIDKLNNKTLGNYSPGTDAMGIRSHIRFNRNFIMLNTDERILETLRHEMIHQWQDEVLYYEKDSTIAKDIKIKMMNEEGKVVDVETRQKKRPKDWHNKDFKDYAKVVGIPAEGDKCYGNPAKMPEPESFNRKFNCACVASNGYPVSVWCTRKINATCDTCGKKYIEIPKGGKVIRVEQSHVELPGQDAVEMAHKAKYKYFERFESKDLKDEFIEHFNSTEEHPMGEMVEGVYQKNHNKYKEGFTHWVAFNTTEVTPDVVRSKEISKVKDPKTTPKKPKAPKAKTPKAPKAKIIEPELPKVEVEVEPAPVEEAPKGKISLLPKKDRSHKNAQDLLELYKEHGSVKAVAEYFGVTSGTIIYQAKQLGVDFKKGVITSE